MKRTKSTEKPRQRAKRSVRAREPEQVLGPGNLHEPG